MADSQVKRYDNIDASEWMTREFERTTEGFLKGRAIVTCAGVFTYKKADGTTQRELRLPNEIFDYGTLDSLKLKPVTLNHPSELVDSTNVDKYQVGSLGDNPSSQNGDWKSDGVNCAVDMIITKEAGISAILNGKQALSMGYTCDIDETPGVWCGCEYDVVQRNIRYNHCAIVGSARAGDNAKITLRKDSGDAVLEYKKIPNGGKAMGLKKITLDGIDYEAEEGVLKALNSEKARADNAEKEFAQFKADSAKQVSELTAERDTLKERCDKAEGEVKSLKENLLDKSRLDEAVKAKMELMTNAQKAGVEVKADAADIDIKKAVILSVFPKANFDGKDEAYIDARYDGAVEMLAAKNDASLNAVLNGGTRADGANPDNARERMISSMKKEGGEK